MGLEKAELQVQPEDELRVKPLPEELQVQPEDELRVKPLPEELQVPAEDELIEKPLECQKVERIELDKELLESILKDLDYNHPRSLEHAIQQLLVVSYKNLFKDDNVEAIDTGRVRKCLELRTMGDSKLMQLLDKIDSEVPPEQRYNDIRLLKRTLLPIDVLELERLVNECEAYKALVKGKDILFVVGFTGAGKTTNILRFLGYELREGIENGVKALVTTTPLKE